MLRTVIRSGSLVCAALLAIGAAPPPRAQPSAAPDPEMRVEALKQAYLGCERAAQAGSLDTSEIMQCSVVYEELKMRVFNGSFGRLLTWADAQLAFGGAGDRDSAGKVGPTAGDK